jgi:hypothetical protein
MKQPLRHKGAMFAVIYREQYPHLALAVTYAVPIDQNLPL